MNLNNLSMNYKILLGISSITIITLIFQYIKNVFNPKRKMIEGQEVDVGEGAWVNEAIRKETIARRRYGGEMGPKNDSHGLSKDAEKLFDRTVESQVNMVTLLQGIYNELGEFNPIYQEKMFEKLIPTQMNKTIIHLSSIDHTKVSGEIGNYTFDLANTNTSGLRKFSNIINLKLLSAQIPYIPHNIYKGDKKNNFLKFNAPEIEIDEGKYTIYSLINKINSLLTNITFGFDPITQYIKITNNSGDKITIDNETYPLFKRLGFHENDTPIDHTASYTSPSIPDISIHYIDILTPDIHPRGYTLTNDDSTILKRIPLIGSMGELIHYQVDFSDYTSQELFQPDTSSSLPTLKVALKRHDGSLYDLKDLHFDLKIEITELVEPTLLNELASHMRRDRERFLDQEGNNSINLPKTDVGGIQTMNLFDNANTTP